MDNIEYCFLIFIIYSFIGWVMEVTLKLIEKHRFINRGFLIGPYCPIYGYGALIMTITLSKYQNDLFVLFIMSTFICSFLEYITSYVMEKLFKARWWDYSKYKINLNGRICLKNSILFGLGGIVIIKLVNPILISIINQISIQSLHYLMIFIFILYLIDNIISFNVINNFRKEAFVIAGDSTELISKKVLKETKKLFSRAKVNSDLISIKINELRLEITNKLKQNFNSKNYLYKRLIKAYPNLETRIKNNDKIIKDVLYILRERSDKHVAKFKRSTKKNKK